MQWKVRAPCVGVGEDLHHATTRLRLGVMGAVDDTPDEQWQPDTHDVADEGDDRPREVGTGEAFDSGVLGEVLLTGVPVTHTVQRRQ
jgi:hypothetical protein